MMSASAPLGRPSRNTGRLDADCTSATITGEAVSVVIIQAEATSFIHMQMFDANHTPHSIRNTGWPSGAQGDWRGGSGGASVDGSINADSLRTRSILGHAHASARAGTRRWKGSANSMRRR